MTDSLPEGWASAKLGSLFQPSPRKAEPGSASGALYLGLEHIEAGTNRVIGQGSADGVKSTTAVFKKGDVLYGKLRPYLNKVALAEFGGVCSTEFLVLPSRREVDSKLLMWFLSRQEVVAIANQNSSGTQLPRVHFSVLEELEFPLPPLAEQRRIVAKVESLLAEVNAARERLSKVPAILKRFRQSVLAAACSGRLTGDWREQREGSPATERWGLGPSNASFEGLPELPTNWIYRCLDEIAERVSVGHVGPTSGFYCSEAEGVRFIRSQNVRPAKLDLAGIQYITKDFHASLKKSQLRGGDLLVVRVGANRGDTCIVPPGLGELNCANIVFARPFPGVSRWLEAYCQSFDGQRQLQEMTTGSAQGVINTTAVAKLAVPIPPQEEQDEVLRRAEALLKVADAIEKHLAAATARADKITQAVLAKAFRGEMVPTEAELAREEGREYEPASVLLERVAASRSREPSKGRKKRNGRDAA